jgi:superfamily I DNA/RNA helicase/RecB family exonuclease
VSSPVSRSSGSVRGETTVRLVRRNRPPVPAPTLDPEQQAAVSHRGGPLRLLGAPGTGVTTTLVEAVVDRVERDGLTPDQILVLAPSRRAAAELRERITGRLNRTAREPIARTPASLAFGILRRAAAGQGLPPPRLLSGPEQDVVLRELLAGHREGAGRGPRWPDQVESALRTRGLRAELRDLMMRAVERGLDPGDLADLGRSHDRPEWVAAADLLREYDEVTALSSPGAYDPALIVGAAERTLADQGDVLDDVRRCARFVAVDDAQEMTPAVALLLAQVVGRGGELLLAGDPDATTLGFRGADPGVLADRADEFAAPGRSTPTVILRTSWRQGPELRAATERVVARVGAGRTGSHRRVTPPPGRPAGTVQAHLLRSAVQEASYVAGVLRRAHLERSVGWGEMAVIVRGTGRAATVRRVLAGAGVPVQVPATELPVRDESAVAPLLDAFEIALSLSLEAAEAEAGADVDLDPTAPSALDVDVVVQLLTSPIGGADAVALRRLRRALRAEERVGGGGRSSDDLLVEAISGPDRLLTLPDAITRPARRVAQVLQAGRAAAPREVGPDGKPRYGAGVTAESVLWAIWAATGLAEPWRRTALAGGAAGARADRDLDAVVALFDAAARFVDRLPQAGPAEFLEHLRGQEVPGDTLVERAPTDDAVSLLTPQGAAGREWRLVAVSGVQVGVWPDTRLRGSLLGSQALVDVLAGRGDGTPEALASAQAAVRQEELRLFHVAVSRATEELHVTAVSGDDEQPSGLLDLVAPLETVAPQPGSDHPAGSGSAGPDGERAHTRLDRPLALPALVARLRQVLTDSVEPHPDVVRAEAAAGLSRLAEAGVRGADPGEWHGLELLSDSAPLVPEGELVPVSPSKVESFDQCGLRWVLETSGGTVPANFAQSVGMLIHELASDFPDADEATLRAELDQRWPRLGLPRGWLTDVQRRRAEQMVTKLAAYAVRMSQQGRSLVGVELEVVAQIGQAAVTGRIDRLERAEDGALRIVDLKTGKTSPPQKEVDVNPQLGVYQLAVQAGAFADERPVAAGGELVLLGADTKSLTIRDQPPLSEADDPQWASDLLADVAIGMAAADFVATQGIQCRRCPVRSSCPVQPEGRAVVS